MKNRKRKPLLFVFLAIAILLVMIAQVRVVNERNYTLGTGETISGPLLIMSQNAELQKGSLVKGPVFMLCCNLIVNGKVNGNVFLMSGNLRVDPFAEVEGNVSTMSGNLSK